MQKKQRENFCIFVDFWLDVNEMNVETLNLSFELWKLVQERLTFTPFGNVRILPVVNDLLQSFRVETILESSFFERFCERINVFQSPFQLLNYLKLTILIYHVLLVCND